MAAFTTDTHAEAFRRATLESERTRILCLLAILAVVLLLIATRALTTGIPEQQALLPRFIGLISVSAAYEGLMLALVRRAIRRGSDLPDWAWFVTIGVVVILWLRRAVYRRPPGIVTVTSTTRALAVVSLLIWIAAIATGRLMAYPELFASWSG